MDAASFLSQPLEKPQNRPPTNVGGEWNLNESALPLAPGTVSVSFVVYRQMLSNAAVKPH